MEERLYSTRPTPRYCSSAETSLTAGTPHLLTETQYGLPIIRHLVYLVAGNKEDQVDDDGDETLRQGEMVFGPTKLYMETLQGVRPHVH